MPQHERNMMPHQDTSSHSPYASSYTTYRAQGWQGTLKLPLREKYPPPTGYTGTGPDPSDSVAAQWAQRWDAGNIGLRMPEGVVGIDVDHYGVKRGADVLDALTLVLGELPATWSSTSRGNDDGPGPSRVLLYRLPEHRRLAGKVGDAIEIIQRHHRYMVAWPSIHPATQSSYRWYTPEGLPSEDIPSVSDLALLPEAWVEHLAKGAAGETTERSDPRSGALLLQALRDDERPQCREMADAINTGMEEIQASGAGSRHDATIAPIHRVIMLGAQGHPGAAAGLEILRWMFNRVTDGDREEEFDRAVDGSVRKAVTALDRTEPVAIDPCALMENLIACRLSEEVKQRSEAANKAGVFDEALDISLPAFEPTAKDDQSLAEDIITHVAPEYRYMLDSGTWIAREPAKWTPRPRLSGRSLVARVTRDMPKGSPDAEEGSTRARQWELYQRLRKSPVQGSIGSLLDSVSALGGEVTLFESDLDTNPEIMWAGGVPWDLRASAERPVRADIDIRTPHMHSALIGPNADVATPYWTKFVETIWPDSEVRAWAMRVMSITLAGYPDAALPVLYGPERTGKSSFVQLLLELLGTYAYAADPRLLSGGENTHASVIYALKGRRLAFIDEGPRRGHLATERLKQLTGGAALTGNAMRANPITFNPTHTLVMTTNDEPQITDPALRARVRVIPCEADPKAVRSVREAITPQVLAQEAPGILAGLMREVAGWLDDRHTGSNDAAPLKLRMDLDEMAASQDPVREWLEEAVIPDTQGTKARVLYRHFAEWLSTHPLHRRTVAPSESRWGRVLTEAGFEKTHRRDGKYRPLIIRRDGYPQPHWFPVDNSEKSTPKKDVTGPMTGIDQLKTEPVTVQNSSSNPLLFSDVTTVTTNHSILNKNNTNIYIQNSTEQNGEWGSPSHSGHPGESKPDLTSNNADMTASGKPDIKPSSTDATDLTDVASSGLSRTALKQAKADERRQAAIEESQGPYVGLPAVWERGREPHHLEPREVATRLQAIIARSGYLAVDVETTGYPIGHPHYALRTIQLGDVHEAIVLDATMTDYLEQAEDVWGVLDAAPELVAHSATADIAPLAYAGLVDFDEAMSKMTDTAILAKLADPAGLGAKPGLKEAAPVLLGQHCVVEGADEARKRLFAAGKWLTNTTPTTPPTRSGWAQVDLGCATMVRYAAADVLDCAALKVVLPQPEPVVLARERAVAAITARSSYQGLLLDGEAVTEQLSAREPRIEQLQASLEAQGLHNPSSPPQVLQAFAEHGHTLEDSTKETLTALARPTGSESRTEVQELAQQIVEYRQESKIVTAFLKPWFALALEGDSRLRPTVYTLEADTGRMSCVRPNLQQVPRKGGLRECIVAREGHSLIAADFSSVEVRVAAAISQDRTLMQMIHDGTDMHLLIARRVWGDHITKGSEERNIAKRIVFGRLYGGGAPTLARQSGITVQEAEEVIKALDAMTPGLVEWTRELKTAVKAGQTQYRSYSGRIIHLPADTPHKAPNYVIQGSARELLVDALLQWEQGPYGGGVILPVHDEIVAEVPDEVAEEALTYLRQCMTTTFQGIEIAAEAWEHPQKRWSK